MHHIVISINQSHIEKEKTPIQEIMNDILCFTFIEQLYKARFSRIK